MKKVSIFVAVLVFSSVGCTHHTVKVEQNEPLRVDVNMRIDVYNHVMEHADAIEKMVNDNDTQSCSFWRRFVKSLDLAAPVYAESKGQISKKLGQDTLDAINNRNLRRDEIIKWQSSGSIGENSSGYVQIYSKIDLTENQIKELERLIKNENDDRKIIYTNLAQIEGTSVVNVGKIYAEKMRETAPSGTPVQVIDEKHKSARWVIK